MSSETGSTRQRTVAELLAEHGGAAATTGRRRHRRETDGRDDGVGPPAPGTTDPAGPGWQPAEPPAPDRAILREPVPSDTDHAILREPVPRVAPPLPRRDARPPDVLRRESPSREIESGEHQPRAAAPAPAPDVLRPVPLLRRVGSDPPADTGVAAPLGHRAPADPARDRPTDTMRRVRNARPGVLDPGLTGPIEHQRRPAGSVPELVDPVDGGPWPATARRSADHADAGPPTQAGDPPLDFDEFDDHPAGLGADADRLGRSAPERPETGDGAAMVATPARRLGRAAAGGSTGHAWMAVVAQWIIGAVGGAALWVGFRFLWRELPVVALAAAVLVTVGLVLVVRAVLRNDDMRTTVFAVLVGLLLTVSPALLVLLGR